MQEDLRACLGRDQHCQDQGLSRNNNLAPAYMLTNLVDVTTTFKIVDIHLYMMGVTIFLLC
jgi:hypothetical protein